ncbi:MAG: ATP-binding protein [Succinivibrio sp.]|nr:ATP-binding protein [Succinivibrio sp.]
MYIQRNIENTLLYAMQQTKVVLLCGIRQAGKSTLLRQLFPDYDYVSLDDIRVLRQAREDPVLFFKDRQLPLIIDEVQYAPELFLTIKHIVDQQDRKGLIILTGSQSYELLSKAAESLAGRISLLELPPLSQRELSGSNVNRPFIPGEYELRGRLQTNAEIWQKIIRGSMPELAADSARNVEWFYRDYVRTYLERDVRNVLGVQNLLAFGNFMTSLAARTTKVLLYEDLARDCGLSLNTVRSWLSVLCATGMVKLLQCYRSNLIQRALKAPKLFFMDCGLVCYLTGWKTPEQAASGAMNGALFENFVISEIAKTYLNAGHDLKGLYYYRDKDQKEIDLLIEGDQILYPVEIKKSATPDSHWLKHFPVLTRVQQKTVGEGAVLCLCDELTSLSEQVKAVPVEYL